jgi:hypothetical protein
MRGAKQLSSKLIVKVKTLILRAIHAALARAAELPEPR